VLSVFSDCCNVILGIILIVAFLFILVASISIEWQNCKLESENIYSLYFILALIKGHGCKKLLKCHECMSICGCDQMTDSEFCQAVGKDRWYHLIYGQFHMIDPKQPLSYRHKQTRSPFSLQALSKLTIQKEIVAHIISVKQWTELVRYTFHMFYITGLNI